MARIPAAPMLFKNNEEVLFGRENGEKTRGKIVKVNPTKYKIEQLEQRGTMRDYKVGTIWTVAPEFVYQLDGTKRTEATSTAAPAKPAVALPTRAAPTRPNFRRGQKATFDKDGKAVTGTVKSVNEKTVTLVDCDDGCVLGYRVPFRLFDTAIAKGGPKAPATTATTGSDIKPGVPVTCKVGGRKVTGVVVSVTGTFADVYGFARFGFTAPVRLVDLTRAPKRGDGEIISDARSIFSALSPENLHCDGEISRTAAMAKKKVLDSILRALNTEIGREITESEAYASVRA